MQILITGALGFVGQCLVEHLLSSSSFSLVTSGLSAMPSWRGALKNQPITYFPCNLTQPNEVGNLIGNVNPDIVVHLAAMSHVTLSSNDLNKLFDVNIQSTRFLCHALSSLTKPVHLLLASSALVYQNHGQRILYADETTLPDPISSYACSKLAAEAVARMFANERLSVSIVRPFNHIGPGQSEDFVAPAFAKRVKLAREGDCIEVGNLDAVRDFSDVRDIVVAYEKILHRYQMAQKTIPPVDTFVLGTGIGVTMKTVLDSFMMFSRKKLTTKVNPKFYRHEPGATLASPHKARSLLGWQPTISLENSLENIFNSMAHRD